MEIRSKLTLCCPDEGHLLTCEGVGGFLLQDEGHSEAVVDIEEVEDIEVEVEVDMEEDQLLGAIEEAL